MFYSTHFKWRFKLKYLTLSFAAKTAKSEVIFFFTHAIYKQQLWLIKMMLAYFQADGR